MVLLEVVRASLSLLDGVMGTAHSHCAHSRTPDEEAGAVTKVKVEYACELLAICSAQQLSFTRIFVRLIHKLILEREMCSLNYHVISLH